MGTYRGEISKLREHIAWYHGEAERINAMPPSKESGKLGEGKKP